MGPGLTRIFVVGKSSQNSSKPVLIFWSSILSVYTLKVVSYYDLSVLMGFQKKVWMGGVGGVRSIQFFLGFFELCKPLS